MVDGPVGVVLVQRPSRLLPSPETVARISESYLSICNTSVLPIWVALENGTRSSPLIANAAAVPSCFSMAIPKGSAPPGEVSVARHVP